MMKRLRERTYEILESTRPDDLTARLVQGFIIGLILINVVAVVLVTVESLGDRYRGWFRWIEIVSVAVFTVEYVLRVWACVEDERYDRPILGRLRYMVTPGALIDLAAILPFYLRLTNIDLRAIRTLRLFRLFRLLKLGRYSRTMDMLGDVLRDKRGQLALALAAVLVMLVFSSSLMYYAEHDAQPDKFGSIPETFWWGVITLTTVGYGNVYPVTVVGKILGGVICLMGIGLFALPAGILSSGFKEALKKKGDDEEEDDEEESGDRADDSRAEKKYCPCCGRKLDEEERDRAETEG